MMMPRLLSTLAALVAVLPASAQDAAAWSKVEAWAKGSKASFTSDKLTGFLAARKGDVRSGATPAWLPWLTELSTKGNANLKAWALARRVEAGDFSAILALEKVAFEHMINATKPYTGKDSLVIQDMPLADAGPTFRMDARSPYFPALLGTVKESPTWEVTPNMYGIWCYNTQANQRPYILEIAKHLTAPVTKRSPQRDPWNDARFWIVADWLMAWGTEEDFQTAMKNTPEMVSRGILSNWLLTLQGIGSHMKGMPTAAVDLAALKSMPVGKATYKPMPPSLPTEAAQRRIQTTVRGTVVADAAGKVTHVYIEPAPWVSQFVVNTLRWGYEWKLEAGKEGKPSMVAFTLPYFVDVERQVKE